MTHTALQRLKPSAKDAAEDGDESKFQNRELPFFRVGILNWFYDPDIRDSRGDQRASSFLTSPTSAIRFLGRDTAT
jgi:hypothetical protein